MTTTAQVHTSTPSLYQATLDNFKQITKHYALFHICFFSLAFLELVAFVLFFSFLTQTTLFAFSLATLFLTSFTYFVLLFYFQAKKLQQLLDIHAHFLHHCAQMGPEEKVHALEHLLQLLHRQEYSYYALPHSFQTLSPLMQKFSAWIHWKDLHKIKELILTTLVHKQIECVKLHPTDLKTHAHLAQTYLTLSELYTDPRELHPAELHPWISPEYASAAFDKKRDKALCKALEEYKILSFYAPHEPWVHEQLAQIHCTLGQLQEAIHAYETILAKISEDSQILLRLGVLYFETGDHARALRLYERLKSMHDPRAEELIAHYG